MADIFDQLAVQGVGKQQAAPSTPPPTGDIFDQLAAQGVGRAAPMPTPMAAAVAPGMTISPSKAAQAGALDPNSPALTYTPPVSVAPSAPTTPNLGQILVSGVSGAAPTPPPPLPSQETVQPNQGASGAFVRGAKSSLGSAAGATALGTIGSVGGPVTGVPLALLGSYLGGKLQNEFFPPTPEEASQAALDEQNHKIARIAGEFAPALITARPAIGNVLDAAGLTGVDAATQLAAAKSVGLGTLLGGAIPAVFQAGQGQPLDPWRIGAGAATGATLEPNSLGRSLFNKNFRTETAAQDVANNAVLNAVPEARRPDVVAKLDNAGELNQGGVQLMSGDISNDPGLLTLQRAAANKFDKQGKLAVQDQGNQAAVGNNVAATTAPPIGPVVDPALPGSFYAQDQAARQTAVDAPVTEAQTALDAGKTQLTQAQQPITSNASTSVKADASTQASQALNQSEAAANAQRQSLYDAVDPNLPMTFSNTADAANAAIQRAGKSGQASIPPIIKSIAQLRAPQVPEGAPEGTAPVPHTDTFAEMQADLRNINGELNNPAYNPTQRGLLSMVKDGIQQDLQAGGQNSEALQAANQFNATEYAPKFQQGPSSQVFKPGQGGADSAVPVSETIGRYMTNADGAKQLASAIGQDPTGQSAVRDWLVSDLANSTGANPMADNINTWLNKRGAQLDAFPDVRREVQQMSNRLSNGSTRVMQLDNDLQAKLAAAKGTADSIAQEPGSGFVGANTPEAVASVMSGKNSAANMQALLDQAAKDKTGAATEGLTNGVKTWLNQQVRNTGKVNDTTNTPDAVQTSQLQTSLAKMNDLMQEGSDSRAALAKVFTPEQMQMLDMSRKQIETMSRRNQAVMGGSQTDLNRNAGNNASDSVNGAKAVSDLAKYGVAGLAAHNPGLVAATGVLNGIKTHWTGDIPARAQSLLVDMISDPDKAATALRPLNTPTAKSRFIDLINKFDPVSHVPMPEGVKPYTGIQRIPSIGFKMNEVPKVLPMAAQSGTDEQKRQALRQQLGLQ